MPWDIVKPVVDESVRKLCVRPYPGHPRGCPNFFSKPGCPPDCQLITNVLDFSSAIWVVWNRYDFGEHVERMRKLHSHWSDAQLRCCLYWQPKARQMLECEIEMFSHKHPLPGLVIARCPEGAGVNITATMKQIGIELEWPPQHWAYQVVLAGRKSIS